jgi:protein tyrosine phosphatase
MKSFMTSGSLSQGREVDKVSAEEDVVMTIYDRRPSLMRCCVPEPSLGTPAHCSMGCGNAGVYIYMYITYMLIAKKKKREGEAASGMA